MRFRTLYILANFILLIKKHRKYVLAPLLLILAALAGLVIYLGPGVIMAFIYAGI
ncbi:MAG: DUF5989 family protein [Candidatus Muiribacteriaceae bacterium]